MNPVVAFAGGFTGEAIIGFLPCHARVRVPRQQPIGYAVGLMAPELTDEELMLRFQRGDAAAFEVLYRRYRNPLMGFLRRHTGDHALAEELFQDLWTSIIRRIGEYRVESTFRTYLYHNARNRLVDVYRRQRETVDIEAVEEELPASVPVDEQADSERRHRRLMQALDELPDEQREAFLLKEEAGLSLAEVAAATGVNTETAKSRLRYAFKKLRSVLVEDSQGETG